MWGRARRRSRLLVTSSAQACFLPSGKNAFPCLVVLILTSQYIGCASRSAAAASARFIPQRSRRVDGDFGSPRSRRVCFRGSTSSFALSFAAGLHREESSRQSDEDSADALTFSSAANCSELDLGGVEPRVDSVPSTSSFAPSSPLLKLPTTSATSRPPQTSRLVRLSCPPLVTSSGRRWFRC